LIPLLTSISFRRTVPLKSDRGLTLSTGSALTRAALGIGSVRTRGLQQICVHLWPKVTEYRSGCVRFTKIFLLSLDYHIFSILWGPSID
jgi:hypothetical protein